MPPNKLPLTCICLLANFVLAGFIVQAGLLIGPISRAFAVDITYAAKQFTLLYGGYFAGNMLAFFILDYISIRIALLAYCALTLAAVAMLHFVNSQMLLPVMFTLIGLMGGMSATAAGTIISKIWQQKHRETLFLGQDACFNLGGTLYPMATTLILVSGLAWTISFLTVAAGLFLLIFLILISNFDFDIKNNDGQKEQGKTEWNTGIFIAGIALFLSVLAKLMIIIWLPHYAQTRLSATTEEAGQLISSIYGAALVGSIAGTIIITRVRLSYFIICAIFLGLVSSVQFVFVESISNLLVLCSVFGLAISVLYNVFTVYGLSFIKQSSHKNIAFVLFCGGLATTVSPYLSSLIVEWSNTQTVLMVSAGLYALVLAILLIFEIFYPSRQAASVR